MYCWLLRFKKYILSKAQFKSNFLNFNFRLSEKLELKNAVNITNTGEIISIILIIYDPIDPPIFSNNIPNKNR